MTVIWQPWKPLVLRPLMQGGPQIVTLYFWRLGVDTGGLWYWQIGYRECSSAGNEPDTVDTVSIIPSSTPAYARTRLGNWLMRSLAVEC